MSQERVHTGTATYLFSDLEGSTDLLQRLGPEAYASALSGYREFLEEAGGSEGGEVVDQEGDGIFLAFPTASGAIRAAARAQRLLLRDDEGPELRARMGLHTGEALRDDHGFVSLEVHRAARVADAAWGGQILLTHRTWGVARDALGGEDLWVVDLGEHRLKDLSQPVGIFQLTAPGLPRDFPVLRTLSPDRHNLPVQLTSFVGREEELARVRELLGEVRLVTLTGVGGSGKTRLALQAAAGVLEEHPDGAWLVELAGLTDSERIADEVAKALGIREGEGGGGPRGSRPIQEHLVAYLEDKELLLVLDNCEHLLEGAGRLADLLLRSCPGIGILATSREGLGIGGEALFQVPSLGLPDPDSPEQDADALLLFAERARAVLPSFSLTAEARPHVERICRRLDGIPLAIELAAARVKVLGVDQLAGRLGDRFRLLTGGSRTALPRQQTLEATIDWSYELLTDEERTLLRRLSVFSGGFTLEAAEAVCSGGAVAEPDVLELLSHLVDKSLVATVEGPAGPARYRLLETLRAYARDKLTQTEDAEGTRRHHRDWFLALAEEAAEHLHGPDQGAWLDRLETEHDNLRDALEWSLGAGEGTEAARLAASLAWYWLKDHRREGITWVERIVEAFPDGPVLPRLRVMLTGALLLEPWDTLEAIRLAEGALELAETQGEEWEMRARLGLGGALVYDRSRAEEARRHLEAAASYFEHVGDRWAQGRALLPMGLLSDLVEGIGVLEEAARCFAEAGDRVHYGNARYISAAKLLRFGSKDLDQASSWAREALEVAGELGSRHEQAHAKSLQALVSFRRDESDQATALCEACLDTFRQLGDIRCTARMLALRGFLTMRRGDVAEARACFREAAVAGLRANDLATVGECLDGQGALAEGMEAVRWHAAARAQREAAGVPANASGVDYVDRLAELREELGDEAFETAWEEGRSLDPRTLLGDSSGDDPKPSG